MRTAEGGDALPMTDSEREYVKQELEPIRAATISIAFVPPKPGPIEPAVFTSFGVSLEGQVFLLTAAHVLDDIDTAFEKIPDGKLLLKGMGALGMSTPYRREPRSWTHLSDTFTRLIETGGLTISGNPIDPKSVADIDIGAIKLGQIYKDSLSAVGFRPLPMEVLGFPTEDEVESFKKSDARAHYFLHGALADTVLETTGNGDFSYDWTMLPIEPICFAKPRFEFKPLWSRNVRDAGVIGTSGGPIVLVGFEGARVIGIQSSQLAKENQIPSRLYAWDIQFLVPVLWALVSTEDSPAY